MTQHCPHDGGYCHHRCVTKCFRMGMDAHLTTPHEGYPVPGDAPVREAPPVVVGVPDNMPRGRNPVLMLHDEVVSPEPSPDRWGWVHGQGWVEKP